MALNLSEKDLDNPTELSKKLITLAEIIIRKHFYASAKDKEDLVSVGILKAMSMIQSGKFSKGKGNFATFLYTGMRNDMHNYLYHQNKFETVDFDTFIDRGECDKYFVDYHCYLDYSLIHLVCMKFEPSFGDSIESKLIEKFVEMGFEMRGMPENRKIMNKYVSGNNVLEDTYGKVVSEDVINRLVGVVLWKKKEHDRMVG